MANLRLKKTILEIVDNQLKANDPPGTKDTYEKLVNAGYSKSEAKDKIGAVVLTEIYDVLKMGQDFDEEKYRNGLEEMLRQSIDYEDEHYIRMEWDEMSGTIWFTRDINFLKNKRNRKACKFGGKRGIFLNPS